MTVRTKWLWLGGTTALATCFGVFVLPFLLPPAPIQAISAANTAGFNNRVAAVAAAVISVGVLLAAWRLRLQLPFAVDADCKPMSQRWIAGWSLGLVTAMAVLCAIAYLADLRYLWESRYFIEQMSKATDYHRRLYAQLEFPYGPLLFYPTIWLRVLFSRFAHPLQMAYVATLLLHEMAGALLLAYILQCLPIATRLRRWVFPCFLLLSVTLPLGINYTLFRFAMPLATLLFCLRGRQPMTAALLVLAGEFLNLNVSPEMGFAFGCGATTYALLQLVLRRDSRWLLAAGAVLVSSAGFFLLVGPNYLSMLKVFSVGTFNLVVEPQPYTLICLVALVWLAPLCMASCWRAGRQDASLLTAAFVLGLALLPAVFARADTEHVIFNALTILLLALIPVGAWTRKGQAAWIACMFLIVMTNLIVLATITRGPYRLILERDVLRFVPVDTRRAMLRIRRPTMPGYAEQLAAEHPLYTHTFDIARTRAITGGAKVTTPADVSFPVEDALRATDLFVPNYYSFGQYMISASVEAQEIAAVNAQEWLLLPGAKFPIFYETSHTSEALQGIPLPYTDRRSPFRYGLQMEANIEKNWQPVTEIDEFTLFRRRW